MTSALAEASGGVVFANTPLGESLIQLGVTTVGVSLACWGAVYYFRHVRMEHPPIGTFNGRDVAFLLLFITTLPTVYGFFPTPVITIILLVTFSSALYIGYQQVAGRTATWLGIGLLLGSNFWTSHHLEGSNGGWQIYWTELTVIVLLGAIAVANLYVQGGMRLRHVAWFALALSVYDLVFSNLLPATGILLSKYISYPLFPLLGMRFVNVDYAVGLGDILVYSTFMLAAYKAYGAKAAKMAFGVVVVFGAGVTSFIPILINFVNFRADTLIPAQVFFGPAAYVFAVWMQRRYGPERRFRELANNGLASQEIASVRPVPETASA